MNIGSILTNTAATSGSRAGIQSGDLTRTYSDWNARSAALAASLRDGGVTSGDRVVILQDNGPALLETLFGVFKAGAIAVPVNARLHPEEFRFIIEHCEASAVVFSERFAEALDPTSSGLSSSLRLICTGGNNRTYCDQLDDVIAGGNPAFEDVPMSPTDVCWLFYTSGTTGRPKGAMITAGNLDFMCHHYPQEVRNVSPPERVVHVAPLTHASGLWALPLTAAGATHMLPTTERFDPHATLDLVEEQAAAQIVFVSPTMLTMLSDAYESRPRDLNPLKLIGYGGSPVVTVELERAIRCFGPVLLQVYGQGECPMTITMLSPDDHVVADTTARSRLASAGRRRADIEVEVVDDQGAVVAVGVVGEVAVRGPVVMKGYWDDPDATASAFVDGWYRTGDVGRFDEDGYLFLLDRLKDLIITGGSNVYGREVEDVLARHDRVAEVAVVGLPDPKWVEAVTAVVVPIGDDPLPIDEFLELCDNHLARFKRPRRWIVRESLPKNNYGKVLKRQLRQELSSEEPTSQA